MYNGIEKINAVVDYIETHLCDDIQCTELARIAELSAYEFRRIFSFIIGVPVAEYIRTRRLSRAAEDIKLGAGSLGEISERYGYDSASSFGRAFRDMFGVSPKKAAETDCYVAAVTKPSFDFTMRNMESIPYTIKPLPAFSITGVRGVSSLRDTVCCESVWRLYEAPGTARRLAALSCDGKVYAAYENHDGGDVLCRIGVRTGVDAPEFVQTTVAAGLWVLFDAQNGLSEQQINDLYAKILFAWLPSGRTRYDGTRPNVEIFSDDGTDAFTIMIPVAGVEESGER